MTGVNVSPDPEGDDALFILVTKDSPKSYGIKCIR